MARKQRIFIENMTYHVLLNCLDHMGVFEKNVDKEFFLDLVAQYSQTYDVQIHSYILDKEYFEFLATSKLVDSIPKFMQSLGRLYVNYYNKKYDRSGTLWQGRYKSSLVEYKNYLFDVMSFIERRTKTKYSSLDKNLFDKKNPIITYHDEYKKLGYTQEDRIKKYKTFFDENTKEKDAFIFDCLQKQKITASKEFIKKLEDSLGLALHSKKRGRPKKIKKDKKMYKNLQILDKEKHKSLKVSDMNDLFFAKDLSILPVTLGEITAVGKVFPIVFVDGKNPSLSALLSLGGENLAINSEGKWITNYVPLALRKYPFSVASVKDNVDQKIIMIDEDSSLVSKSKGKLLFKKDGSQSELLENAIKFLMDNEKHVQITKKMVKEIVDSGILEEREVAIGEGDEKKVLVNGFKVVDREKLNKLSDDILASWARRGIILIIEEHLKTLDNINTLFELANQRQQ
ncbi:SapC family protein [Halarcobacter sp.]|uniref:SapC family protein n=1 Tax=Halarcobacter sp. TaxID=2321133 RepID=UPI0029F51F70|nr:SapC family protein [Halarcobacter sp.]